MIGFFIKHKKVRGVITVFLTIIYLSVYLLIGVFVDGGRIRMASTVMEDVQQIATENIMSQYDRGLYEYYGLFGISDYKTEQIIEDIHNQIEETMNMTVPESVVKNFINNTITGVNSAIDNKDMLNSGDNGIKNTIDYAEQIQKDISESNKKFNPYGIDLKKENVSVSYIDLCEPDALRSQMRDEMRYEALMLPAVNFFDSVKELMKVADGIDTVLNITEKTGSKSNIKKMYKEYQDQLKNFSKRFKEFIEKTYELKWKEISSLKFKTQEKKPETESSLDVLFGWLPFWKKNNSDTTEQNTNDNNDIDRYDHIKTSFATDKADKDDVTGLKKSLEENRGNLNKFCNEFDEEEGWPYGEELDKDYETDANGNTKIIYYYGDISKEVHKEKIRKVAKERAEKYIRDTWGEKGQGDLMICLEDVKNEIEESINKIDSYLNEIGILVNGFEKDCNESKDDTSKKIYANSIENHLRQWNDGAEQKKVLIEIKEKLDKLVTEMDIEVDLHSYHIPYTIENIVNEAHGGEFVPDTKLLDNRKAWIDKFHGGMIDLVSSINKYQEQAIGEEQKADVFQLISALVGNNDKESKSFFDLLNDCGELTKHEISDNKIFDYAEYLKEKQAEQATNTKIAEFKDDDMQDFEEDGVEDKINGIFSIAKDIVSTLINALIENIYDETYILTNCRDFVHTRNYVENKEKIDEDPDKDTIFNNKFIEDKSETKYLTDKQFKDYEVTPAEIEYILFGDPNTKDSVVKMYWTVFGIRFVLNYIAALSSPRSQIEAAALGAVPFVGAALAIAAPIIYAAGQAGIEVNNIMNNCKKEEIWNGSPTLSLFDPIIEISSDTITALKDTLCEKVEEVDKVGTRELIQEIRSNNNDPVNSYISSGVSTLEKLIDEDLYQAYDPITDKIGDVASKVSSIPTIKAGYSDYLLIMLFMSGFDKKTQIDRLQDIIEANMKKAHGNDFSLANTYSQISVETNSTIKYLFMNQSLMRKNITGSQANSFVNFPLNIKTSFAY